jgi:hypothetical protein
VDSGAALLKVSVLVDRVAEADRGALAGTVAGADLHDEDSKPELGTD